ncbi:unnamed protein product [Phytophthora fragariaefolia]|uniref:Unnamed protein product n=1 Tax=Phytophthora fragariaefolia TaxID=1490495 RepID=A0A9W6XRX5_9STRA|nr:unnamed protein product [Phytophthora fragariaefolia]
MCIGASERYLAYREFQVALGKIARVRYHGNCGKDDDPAVASPKQESRPTELELVSSLVDQLTNEIQHRQLDTLRCQMIRCSTLDTLETNSPLLVQSFQLYGPQNSLTANTAISMLSTITLEGFIDFLNARDDRKADAIMPRAILLQMSTEVLLGFDGTGVKTDSKDSNNTPSGTDVKLNFAQFLELFCRVASSFHHKLLVREGAQLRRAVEACRLEFSLEVLLDHMHITLIPNDGSMIGNAPCQHQQEGFVASVDMKEFPAERFQSPRGDDAATVITIVQSIRDVLRLDTADHALSRRPRQRLKREGSLVNQGHLSNRSSRNLVDQSPSGRSTPTVHSAPVKQAKSEERRKPPPQVAMIREIVMPPALPGDVVQLLESALKFQNMGQHNLYLAHYPQPRIDPIVGILDPIHTEVLLFLTLQAASMYDSARRDAQALMKYYEAVKLSRQLPAIHPGRLLARSCLGVTLFYVGEVGLALQCHQLVLETRKASKSSTAELDTDQLLDNRAATKMSTNATCTLIDTATAMNNVACCLSHDQTAHFSKSLDDAYLLFKHARQVYADAFGPAHPRVGLISRNLDRVRACQNGVVSDASEALARGKYAHVIPGSRFHIQALEFVAKPPKSSSAKSGKSGGKKKKSAK